MLFEPSFDQLATAIVVLNSKRQACYFNQSAIQLFGINTKQISDADFLELIQAEFELPAISNAISDTQIETLLIEDTNVRTISGFISTNLMVQLINHNHQSLFALEFQANKHQSHIRKDIALQKQNQISNHLVKNLAHEIKNPLGGIKGAAQLLERKLPDSYSNQYTQIIIQEAERLGKLVDRLLLPADPEPEKQVNIHQLIENAASIIYFQFPNIKIKKDYDPSIPDVFVSPAQIQQALLNLIKNAAEALIELDDGFVQLTTRILFNHPIGQQQHKQVVRIDVIDNGIGIDKNLADDIFFPTISGKNSSGLGLSIAQSLIQKHKGIIELETLDTQTCFSMFIPIEAPNDE